MSDYPKIYELSKKIPNRYKLTTLVYLRANDLRAGYPILNLEKKGIIETNSTSEDYLKDSHINIAEKEIFKDKITLKEKEINSELDDTIKQAKSGKISTKNVKRK